MIIKVSNTLANNAPITFLASSLSAGTTVFNWKNYNQFSANWAVQFGKTGEERAEIRVLTSSTPSGTLGTVTSNVAYDHITDTPVYAIHYDQIVFEVSTVGTVGTASPITSGTVYITPDSDYTQFDHTSGATTYAYKSYFRNSVSGDISAESDWLTPSGYSFYSLNKLRERAKQKLFSASYIKDDAIIDNWLNEWLERMNNTIVAVNQDYSLGTTSVALGTSGLGTITATDYKDIRKIEFTTDGSTWRTGVRASVIDFNDVSTYSDNEPYYYMYGDNVFGKLPQSTGTARIAYYKLPAILSNETDELPVAMRGYTRSFVDYCLAQAYYLDAKETAGDRFMSFAEKELTAFSLEVGARHKSGVENIQITEPLTGEDYAEFF